MDRRIGSFNAVVPAFPAAVPGRRGVRRAALRYFAPGCGACFLHAAYFLFPPVFNQHLLPALPHALFPAPCRVWFPGCHALRCWTAADHTAFRYAALAVTCSMPSAFRVLFNAYAI